MAREATEMIVGAVAVEASDTKTIRLDWPAGYDVNLKTGQFITCYWPDEPGYKRAYSLSSCALDRGFYEFTVRRDGKMGTRLVDWIKPDQRLMVLPPAGKFLPVYEANTQPSGPPNQLADLQNRLNTFLMGGVNAPDTQSVEALKGYTGPASPSMPTLPAFLQKIIPGGGA